MTTATEASTRGEARDLDRLVFFSDAVFAIAITLLVLELRLPTGVEPEHLMPALLHLIPRMMSFAISFLVLATYWMHHRRVFRMVDRSTTLLSWSTLLLLFFVAVIPFPTAVVGEYGYASQSTAVILYAAELALTGYSAVFMQWCAQRPSATDSPAPTDPWPALVAPLVFTATVPLAFAEPQAAMYLWLSIAPLVAVARRRRAAREGRAAR